MPMTPYEQQKNRGRRSALEFANMRAWFRRLTGDRRALVLGAVILAVVLVIWLAIARSSAPNQAGRMRGMGPTPVAIVTVEHGDVPIERSALGTVTPLATVTLRTQISGRLTEVGFTEGQAVKQGDLLAQVDPRPYQFALDQAKGQLERDKALLRNAELDLQRYQTLSKQDSIAKQQVDTQAALVAQYRGTVQSDQANVDTAALNLQYTRLIAPLPGRVGLRQVDVGNYVTPGDTNGVVVLTQTKPITVIFTLAEDDLPMLLPRLRAGAKLPVTAIDRSGRTKLAEGFVSAVDSQVDTTSGTIRLKAQFANEDEALFPNQFVNARVTVDVRKDVPVVPNSAVQRGAPGAFVWLIKDDQTVTARPVTLGVSSNDRVAIEQGLEKGERVVTDGADRLREGAPVLLPGQTPPNFTPGQGNGAGGRGARQGGAPGVQSRGSPGSAQPSTNNPHATTPPATGAQGPNAQAPGAQTPTAQQAEPGAPQQPGEEGQRRRRRPDAATPADGQQPAPAPSAPAQQPPQQR
jgi:membrane fusion protein, multidrug efflux system